MKRDTLREYARMGARRRLDELRQEMSAIRQAFPELFRGGRAAADGAAVSGAATRARAKRRRRPSMTAAQRKAVSERMRKYWAARRKAKAG